MMQLIFETHQVLTVVIIVLLSTTGNLHYFAQKSPESKIHGLIGLIIGVPIWHITSILFGVPVFAAFQSTFLFSCAMSSMTMVGPFAYLGLSAPHFKRVFALFHFNDLKEKKLFGLTLGTSLGAWIGAWPIPLDWERWWQIWPISCLIGALIGYLISIMILSAAPLDLDIPKDNDKCVHIMKALDDPCHVVAFFEFWNWFQNRWTT